MPDIFLKFRKKETPDLTTIHTTIDSQKPIKGVCSSDVEKYTNLFYPYIKFMQKQYIMRSKNLIAVSEWIKSMVTSCNGGIDVIPNGIDINRFSPNNGVHLPDLEDINCPKILFVGRLLEMKGIKTLIDAAKIVLKEKKIHLIFAGSGNAGLWERDLQSLSKDDYSFLGYVDYTSIQDLYKSSDIFVLPSLSESCPLSLLEAMGCQKPPIATKVGGIPEIVEDGVNGFLFEPLDHHQLADMIIYLLDNQKEAREIAGNARKTVVERFNSEAMAEKTFRVYERIIQEQ